MQTIDNFIGEIQKAQQDGGDLASLLASMQTLLANRKTMIGLNQWAASDKPSMEDFNRDNEIIDREIVALHDGKADKTAVYNKTEIDGKVGGKADKVSPAFTGTPTAPTAAQSVNNTQIATTAYVQLGLLGCGADKQTHITGYSTVLDWANAQSKSTFQFSASDGSSIINASDSPMKGCEFQYVLFSGVGNRKTVVAINYLGTSFYIRNIFSRVWRTDWIKYSGIAI